MANLSTMEMKRDPKMIEGLENLSQTWDINYEDLEFGSELARGNFGAVSIANYLGTKVAVKKLFDLEEDMKIYMLRELNVLKQIRHPNIVQFLGLAKTDEGIYIVTEYVSRGDLCHLLYNPRETDLDSWALRLDILIEGAQALAFVHAKNLIHRDIKAANFLVGDNWHVKLCDFGFSRSINSESKKTGSLMTVCGTDEWMAPETAMGLEYNDKADVFSFGMTVVEVALRAEPAPRNPAFGFRFDSNKFRSQVSSTCPPGLVSLVVDQMTVFEPASRPTMKGALDALKQLRSQYQEPRSSPAPRPVVREVAELESDSSEDEKPQKQHKHKKDKEKEKEREKDKDKDREKKKEREKDREKSDRDKDKEKKHHHDKSEKKEKEKDKK